MRNLHKIADGIYPDSIKWMAIWFKLVASRNTFIIRWSPTKKMIEYRMKNNPAWYSDNNWEAYKKAIDNSGKIISLADFRPEWLEWKE